MSGINVSVTHNGTTYSALYAAIKKTFLGWESHGFFTFSIDCESRAAWISVGGVALDGAPAVSGGPRTPTANGMLLLAEVLRTVGVDSWEKVKGQDILVLTRGDVAVGVANPITGKSLVIQEFLDGLKSSEEALR